MAMKFLKKLGGKKDEAVKAEKSSLTPIEEVKTSGVQPRGAAVSASAKTSFAVQPHAILRRLVMTAKAGRVGDRERYVFEISSNANKIEIKKAFYALYGVMPSAVTTSIQKPKKVRFGKNLGARKKWKKATITIDASKSVAIV